MARYILIKKKNSKRFSSAIPIKKGAKLIDVRKKLRTKLPKSLSYRIANGNDVEKIIVNQIKKGK
jgi:hypothetical protein